MGCLSDCLSVVWEAASLLLFLALICTHVMVAFKLSLAHERLRFCEWSIVSGFALVIPLGSMQSVSKLLFVGSTSHRVDATIAFQMYDRVCDFCWVFWMARFVCGLACDRSTEHRSFVV